MDCQHEFEEIEAFKINRFRCKHCQVLFYDLDDGRGKRPYKCSKTTWKTQDDGSRQRRRYCKKKCVHWYLDAAYCSEHLPESIHSESEAKYIELEQKRKQREESNLRSFDDSLAKLRAEFYPAVNSN